MQASKICVDLGFICVHLWVQYLQVPQLYVRGNVMPIGKFATLCVMYKARGVEHMSFDDDDVETKGQTEVDIKCR